MPEKIAYFDPFRCAALASRCRLIESNDNIPGIDGYMHHVMT